jgi:hypothetical protein
VQWRSYRLMIQASAPPDPVPARFAGSWYRHGEELRIRSNGTGLLTFRTYSEPSSAMTMYFEHDTLRFRLSDDGAALTATVRRVRYDGGDGHRVPTPPDHSKVGDTRTFILKRSGALNEHPGRTRRMGADDLAWCTDGVDDAQCGA